MKKIYSSFIAVFVFSAAIAQQKSLAAGVKLLNDLTFNNGFAAGFGGQLAYKMRKHGGLESRIYYTSRKTTFYTYTANNSYYAEVAERRIYLPILYRFESKVVNFTAGPMIDYFIDWTQKSGSGGIEVTGYSRNDIRLIGSASISKTVNLFKQLQLEPELRFNYIIPNANGSL
jgi:hypothetical protein